MIETIYVEKKIKNLKKTKDICKLVKPRNLIVCENYREVFNVKNQNFKIQKQKPALILAKKYKSFLNIVPKNFTIGGDESFYFSHMLNCIYDCRYCFLQGMLRSANYVIFINYKDFLKSIEEKIISSNAKNIHFFSGYDCDSLALEPITRFGKYMLKNLKKYPNIILEFRTKSTQINFLLKRIPHPNVVLAFSISPNEIINIYENKTPKLLKRLNAIKKLQVAGWKIGLRFDPIIYCENFKRIYKNFFELIFNLIDKNQVHSITIGSFRMPKNFYTKISNLYPDKVDFFMHLKEDEQKVFYKKEVEDEILLFCRNSIEKHVDSSRLFVNR